MSLDPMQLPLFEPPKKVLQYLRWLQKEEFDIRKRFYETEENYYRRILITGDACKLDYLEPDWFSIAEWVTISPGGSENRLPKDKRGLGNHNCYFLRIKDLDPENWLIPDKLHIQLAEELPDRATYIARSGDIFLSRFREPMGKCVIYLGEPTPFYVSSNFLLLRPKRGISSFLILAILKSSFLICQLRRLIRRRSVIAEIFINEAVNIMVPNLDTKKQEQLIRLAQQRLDAELQFRRTSKTDKIYWMNLDNQQAALNTMNQIDQSIDDIILEAQNQDFYVQTKRIHYPT